MDSRTLSELVGEQMSAAFQSQEISYDNCSIWSGSARTRTPLHTDSVDGIIFQIAGSKRVFLSTKAEIEEGVEQGRLPEGVLSEGKTDNFLCEGSLDDVHGLNQSSPCTCSGELVTLHPGDCLLLPAVGACTSGQ
jgi:hypothetical protein